MDNEKFERNAMAQIIATVHGFLVKELPDDDEMISSDDGELKTVRCLVRAFGIAEIESDNIEHASNSRHLLLDFGEIVATAYCHALAGDDPPPHHSAGGAQYLMFARAYAAVDSLARVLLNHSEIAEHWMCVTRAVEAIEAQSDGDRRE